MIDGSFVWSAYIYTHICIYVCVCVCLLEYYNFNYVECIMEVNYANTIDLYLFTSNKIIKKSK